MPPIFPPRSNTFARASILVLLVLLAVIVGLLVLWLHSSTFNKVGVAVGQPVAFPHNRHVAVVQLNCRFCHNTVDNASFAGLPPTETCMGCHSQILLDSPLLIPVRESWKTGVPIEWNRVNNVPDHVYFDHQIHVNKGVGCESCHGRVDEMGTAVKAETFYMAWCIDCHRNPERFVRPLDQVYTMGYKPAESQSALGPKLVQEYNIKPSQQLMNCSICHR
jgi:hypothetical protein